MARTKKNTVPVLQHHTPSGQGRVNLCKTDCYCGKWDSPQCKAKYDRLIAEWLLNGRRLPESVKSKSTVGFSQKHESSPQIELSKAGVAQPENTREPASVSGKLICEIAARYMDYCEDYHIDKFGKKSSGYGEALQAIRALEPYDDIPADAFGTKMLSELQTLLVHQGRSRQGCNRILKTIKALFKWAESQELVLPGKWHNLCSVHSLKKRRTIARETAGVKPVSLEVVEKTIPYLPRVVADMVRIQLRIGARPTEVCIMRPMDFDCSEDIWEYRPSFHKTDHIPDNEEKIIPIGPIVQKILKPYLERPADAYLFSPIESEEERHKDMRARRKSKVQPSQKNRRKKNPKRPPGDCYDRDSYRKAVQRAAKKAGVESWCPLQLRHTAATNIRKLGGIEDAQILLGHKDVKITQVYAERDLTRGKEIARRYG
jgi:integrase